MSIINKSEIDVLTAITERRSIRKYTGEPITDDQMDTLLNAGFCAPTAMNRRPWEFVVVRDRAMLDSFAAHARYQKMLTGASAAIIICGDEKHSISHDLLVNDCSAATQNILLAAHGLGLGAVWCGLVQESVVEFYREKLHLPENILPTALVALGHPDEDRPAPERFQPGRVHYEVFGQK